MNANQLFLGVIFSSIGLGYFFYGKSKKWPCPLLQVWF